MASFFKKKGGQVNAANVQMTEAEAALAQSDFNIEKITELQNKFTGGAVLLVPGRIFIREGTLWKMCRRGPKKRHFILFNDILVYCTTVANRYSQQHILPMSQMSVSAECFYQPTVQADFDLDSEVDEQFDVANAFQVSHANKSFHVFAISAADKANWLVNLNKHIARANQSILNDSEQQLVTRPVWVPDAIAKECMLCKVKFTPFVRKHHCRRCGRVVCSSCSPHRVSLNDMSKSISVTASTEHNAKLERACKECFKAMTSLHRLSSSHGVISSGSVSRAPPRPSDPPKRVPSTSSSTKTVSSALPGALHDSSTDTEDSDDSADELDTVTDNLANIELEPRKEDKVQEETPHIEKTRVKDGDIPVSEETPTKDDEEEQPAGVETIPTPPPRKKKLKKQLQQQLQKHLQQQQVHLQKQPEKQQREHQQQQEEEEGQSAQQEEEEKPHGDSPKSVHSEDSNPVTEPSSGGEGEANTPKKSRRKNKYIGSESNPGTTVEAVPEGETDESTKDGATAEDTEIQPSPTQKRARGRRQKFKPPTETN